MLETDFTRLVGCTVPIQVAPMGAISTPALIAAASDAGAFAMIGTAGMTIDGAGAVLDDVAARTSAPVGANMLMPFADKALVEAIAPRVRVFDFYHGDPDAALVSIVHDAGALAAWQVGSLDEARAAVDAGCDLLAVRGVEGGGRMHGNQPLLPLLNAVLDAVAVPVLAAGGLATGRDVAAVIAAGAAGARLGTRFVATHESGAHPRYKQAIVDARADETALVTDFSVLWPNGPEPHRVLTRSLDAARAASSDTVGEIVAFGERRPVPRFAMFPPTADVSGDVDAFAMYAGTSAGSITSIESAAELVLRLSRDVGQLLSRA